MTDDTSTAYICIYCPFNSDNLEALEQHLTSAHGYGCHDVPLPQSSSSPNIISKTNKREAPDDEQSQSSSLDGTKHTTEHSTGAKRLKRTCSPLSTNLFINSSANNSESDDDDDDEPDSSLNLPTTILTCPICDSTYHHLGHLVRHAKRKHRIDLSNDDQTNSFLTSDLEKNHTNEPVDQVNSYQQQTDILPSSSTAAVAIVETNGNSTTTTTDCPYCDFKSTDIEQFKAHIVAHIRDKNYRCLLCNRLYKYRGDCSFHIRRKHCRYSVNSNDYIQRFLFDTTDGEESMSTQPGGHGSSGNGSTNNLNTTREQDEPVRYFGCPYCDYTSNYGGDVRKHQVRKHPNAESKVVKIMRQDSEQQNLSSHRNGFDDNEEEDSNHQPKPLTNHIKSMKKSEKIIPQQQHATPIPMLSNFAPVRVFQCSSCHQQGTYKWVVERHIRAKHPDQPTVHVIELPAELSARLQKITPPLKRFRCSLCPLQSKHSWVVIRHIKHFHTLQTATVVDIQPDGKPINDESTTFPTSNFPSKTFHHDSESSSASSSCIENAIDLAQPQEMDDGRNLSLASKTPTDSMTFTYKCSLCDYQSSISWNIQKHINENHAEQANAYMLTQCRQAQSSATDQHYSKFNSTKKSKHKNGLNRALSPTSALARAKFSPAVEEALLSLQGSKLNLGLYVVQPKFGIKRLKCRHCFYRSNWKTDMIRHVRIRHRLTEPDHNRDMIMMTEQEARSTIELYENTFGKELRRRTFRTWNDWAKAEQEFTPKDGSLQYADTNDEQSLNDHQKFISKKTTEPKSSNHDEIKRPNKPNTKIDTHQESQQIIKTLLFNKSSTVMKKDELKQLPNPSNIVSRLLLSTSPSHNDNNDDEIPLDLSCKSSTQLNTNVYSLLASKKTIPSIDHDTSNIDDDDHSEEVCDVNSTVNYLCSACSYKHSNWSLVQHHISLHLTGQGMTCSLCSYTTSSANSLFHHMTTIHPTSQIPTNCQHSLPILSAHIIEQHQCSICSYQCDRLEALNLHRRLEHDDEEFDIDSSDNEDDIIIASTTKNLFDCPVCSPTSSTNNSTTTLEQLTMHIISNHHNQSCPFCSFTAHPASSQTLISHIKLHFNGTLVQPDPILGIEQVKELLMLE